MPRSRLLFAAYQMSHTQTPACFYRRLLGGAWDDLPAPVRRFHERAGSWRGLFAVRRGENFISRLIATVMRLPAAGERVPVRLSVTPFPGGETWRRTFAGNSFDTEQRIHSEEQHLMADRIGPTEIITRLEVEADGALVYRPLRVSLRLGDFLRVPIPRSLSPESSAREWASDKEPGVYVSVRVSLPLVGLLVAYEGYIEEDESPREGMTTR